MAPPEPIRTKFLEMTAKGFPWFRVAAHCTYSAGRWPCTIKRIDHESWTFHVERFGHEKWLQFRLYDITQFAPAESHIEKVGKALDA